MTELYDKNGVLFKEGQIIKVYHYTNRRRKKCYMYKQVALKKDDLFAWHLPTYKEEISAGYWLKSYADKDGKLDCTEVVQCHCNECIWGDPCI